MSVKRILIDPRCKFNYASYYILGIYELYGTSRIKYKILDYQISSYRDLQKGFGFQICYEDGKFVKVFVDTNDTNSIYETFYDWCDVYAKVNVSIADITKKKIFPIGPSFGVRLWPPLKTIWVALLNYTKVRKANDSYKIPLKLYLKDYLYTIYRRLNFSEYTAEYTDDKNYVFAMSTLWYDWVSLRNTNKYRGEFIRICQQLYENFEGGLFYIQEVESIFPPYKRYKELFKDVLTTKRIGMRKYLQGTRRSSIVFNTPSVCLCHGWKLAEYLSMGKAIISTPLSNVMPGDFIDGVHYLCCTDVESMKLMIESLQYDEKKREMLKCNAKKYFEEYLSPNAVVKRIFERAYLCRN